jgi:hypothetical protein
VALSVRCDGALKASAYNFICLIILTNPLERVGERCSLNPMRSMNVSSVSMMASGLCNRSKHAYQQADHAFGDDGIAVCGEHHLAVFQS